MARSRKIMRIALLFFSIFMILCGIYRKEADMVFQKAINICLECIGIG